jgi:hypothetical protein
MLVDGVSAQDGGEPEFTECSGAVGDPMRRFVLSQRRKVAKKIDM